MIEWYLLVLISALLMGFYTIFEKMLLKSSHASAFISSISVIIALLSLLFIPLANFDISIYELALIYLISLISTISNIMVARSYKHGNISVTSPLLSSIPQFLVVLFAFMFLGEQLGIIQYISIAVLLVMVYLIVAVGKTDGKFLGGKKYVYFLIIAILFMSIGAILAKYVLYTVNPFTFFILISVFLALNLSLYMHFHYGGIKEIYSNIKTYKFYMLLMALMVVVYRLAYYLAIAAEYVSIVSPMRNALNVVVTVFIGGIIFKENDIKKKLAFSLILIFAIYFLVT